MDGAGRILISPELRSAASLTRDVMLLGAGVKLPKSWFLKRHDIPEEDENEEMIGGVVAPSGKEGMDPMHPAPPQQIGRAHV